MQIISGHLLLPCRVTEVEKTWMNGGGKERMVHLPLVSSSSPLRTDEELNLWCYLISPII